MSWSFTQLQTFCAVVDCGSMHRAAERCGYTPGAISQQMTALATAVGDELFVRDGRRVVLSDAGRGFLPHARAMLRAQQTAHRALAEARSGRTTVRVGIFESAGAMSCRPLLQRAATQQPPVDVVFREVDVEQTVEAVRAGTVDIALAVHYSLVPTHLPPGVVALDLLTEPFMEARSAAPKGAGTWIVPPTTETFGLAVQAALRRAGEDVGDAHVVTDTALMVALVEAGVGRALLNPLMLRVHPRELDVRPAPRAGSRSVVALTTRAQRTRPSVEALLCSLEEVFTDLADTDTGQPRSRRRTSR